MTGQEFITTKMRMIEIGKIAGTLNIEDYIKCLENSEKMGPALDPEKFDRLSAAVKADLTLAHSISAVKDAWARTYSEVMKTAGFKK